MPETSKVKDTQTKDMVTFISFLSSMSDLRGGGRNGDYTRETVLTVP